MIRVVFRLVFVASVLATLASTLNAAEIAEETLHIRGVAVRILDANVEAQIDVPCTVRTDSTSSDPSLTVVGELTGPGIVEPLRLETTPGRPFAIPGLPEAGTFLLQNIRVTRGSQVVGAAQPSIVTIQVANRMSTTVKVRQLTAAEIAERGIVVDSSSYDVFEYTFTFIVGNETQVVEVPMPVLVDRSTRAVLPIPQETPYVLPPVASTMPPRWSPPRTVALDLSSPDILPPVGGSSEPDTAPPVKRYSLPAALVLPNKFAVLHEFFSALIIVTNDSDASSAAVLRDISATIRPSAELRVVGSKPSTAFGQPIVIHDKETGADILVATHSGEAEWSLEGLKNGTGTFDVEVRATLDNGTQDPIPLKGTAKGAVVIQDPRLTVTLSHPETVHSGELETSAVDLNAGGRAGWNVLFDRTYKSRTIGSSQLGYGWSSSLFRHLRPLPNGDVEYFDGAGEVWRFVASSVPDGDPYIAPAGLQLRLARDAQGFYLLDPKFRFSRFDNLGRLVSESDEFTDVSTTSSKGNTIVYLYDGSGRLARIVDPVGRSTSLAYWNADAPAKDGLLQSITDWRGRVVSLDYDAFARLTTVKLPKITRASSPLMPELHYSYFPPANDYNQRLETAARLDKIVKPSGGAQVSFTFTGSKVTSEVLPNGRSASLDYSAAPRIVTTDALGQERIATLTAQPKNYFQDRAHVASLVQTNVPTATAPFGSTPPVNVTTPQVAPVNRTTTVSFADGLLKSATLEGVRQTTMTFSSRPRVAGARLDAVTTAPLTAGAKLSPNSADPDSIVQKFTYESDAGDRSGYVRAVSANDSVVQTAEAHRGAMTTASTNDDVQAKTEYGDDGLPRKSSSTGGTDGGNSSASSSIEYFDSTDPIIYRRAVVKKLTRGTDVASSIDYPDEFTVVETDGRGVKTTTKYDEWRRPVDQTVTGVDIDTHESWSYNVDGQLEAHIRKQKVGAADTSTPVSVTTRFEYDSLGRTTKVTTDNIAVDGLMKELTTTTVYDDANRTATTTSPSGAITTTYFDALGRTTKVSLTTGDPVPLVTQYAYDLDDNVVYTTDGYTANAASFDAHGRMKESVDAAGVATRVVAYDAWANAKEVKTVAPSGALVSHSTMDVTATGRVRSINDELGASQARTSSFAWDGGGRTTRTATMPQSAPGAKVSLQQLAASGDARTSWIVFDTADRLKTSKSGAGSIQDLVDTFRSSEVKQFLSATDLPEQVATSDRSSTGRNASFEYDTLGNVKRQSIGTLTWEQSFDESGNVVSAAAPNRRAAKYGRDASGQLVDELLQDGSKKNHQYSAAGAESQYRDETEEPTVTLTDLVGRPTSRTYADGTTEIFTYDGPRLKSFTDRQKRTRSFDYDSAGRVSVVWFNNEKILRYDYDEAGRLRLLTNKDAQLEFANFDLDGNPRKTVQRRFKDGSGLGGPMLLDEYVQEHEWNVHGERTSWTMPRYTGFAPAGWTDQVTEGHDAAGNVNSIERTLFGSSTSQKLLDARFLEAGRPNGGRSRLQTVSRCVAITGVARPMHSSRR